MNGRDLRASFKISCDKRDQTAIYMKHMLYNAHVQLIVWPGHFMLTCSDTAASTRREFKLKRENCDLSIFDPN